MATPKSRTTSNKRSSSGGVRGARKSKTATTRKRTATKKR